MRLHMCPPPRPCAWPFATHQPGWGAHRAPRGRQAPSPIDAPNAVSQRTGVAGRVPVSWFEDTSSDISLRQRSTGAAGPSSPLLRRFSSRMGEPGPQRLGGIVPVREFIWRGAAAERGASAAAA
jgi:hypothetical protein